MKTHHVLAALTAILVVSACDRPAAPAPAGDAPAADATAFKYAEPDDLSGFYLPTEEAATGGYVLDHVFLGQPADFQAWETGTRSATFAPVMLEFQKAGQAQPIGTGDGPGTGLRVLPSRYAFEDGRLHFEGRAAGIGPVVFDGRVDKDALATAKRNLGGGEGAVVTGRLKVGDQTVQNVRLAWYGGD